MFCYFSDRSNCPLLWLTDFTLSGDGGTETKNYNATLIAQTGVSDSPHTKALQQVQNINEASGYTPYNFSNSTGDATVENTANCYVINAPGQYSLPLVYGNAIKNGTTNSSAYISSASGSNVLKNFINHLGAAITNPYIYLNANCTPKDAVLIWQDRLNLVTNVTYVSDNQSITFDVPQENIGQGNAVIAIRDASGQIMWSWHIWITDYKLGTDLKTVIYQDQSYTMLPVSLGWCDSEATVYSTRTCSVRFTQTQTGETKIITINQTENTFSVGANCPYYQWGRKDPILPSAGTDGNLNKTWYNAKGEASTTLVAKNWAPGNVTIISGIINPEIYCANVTMDNIYFNLWSSNNNTSSLDETTSVKTVYDPCPEGYKIPVPNAFRAFTTTGDDTSDPSNINGIWDASLHSWAFECDEGSVLFPILGFRFDVSGVLSNIGLSGYCWTAIPSLIYESHSFGYYATFIYPQYLSNRAYGILVRPIREL